MKTERCPGPADVMAAIGLSIFTFDANGVFQTVVGPLLESLGYPPDFSVGTRASAILHPEDQSVAAETLLRVRVTGKTIRRRLRALRCDGSFVPVDLVFTSAFQDPQINGFVVTVQIPEEFRQLQGPADSKLDASIPDRIRKGRELLSRFADESSGSNAEQDRLLSLLIEVTGAVSASISIVRRDGDLLELFLSKHARSGLLSREVRSALGVAPNSPVRDALSADEPFRVDDLESVRQNDFDGAGTLSAIFGQSTSGMLVPCNWGQQRGIVALGGPLDAQVALRLRSEIARATRTTVETFLTTETLVRDQQAKYAALLENTADFVAILDRDFRFSFLSPSIARSARSTVDAMLGTSCLRFVDTTTFVPLLEGIPPGQSRNIPGQTGSNGKVPFVFDLMVKNMLDDPLIQGWIVNGRDVTAEHQKGVMERMAVMRRSEIAALSAVVANAPLGQLGATLWTHLKRFIDLIGADRCLVWSADETRNVMTILAEAVKDVAEPVTGRLPEYDLETIKTMTGNARMIANTDDLHQTFEDYVRVADGPPIGASTFFPLRSGGQLVGLLVVIRLEPEAFDEDTNLHSVTFADTIASALDRRSVFDLLEVQALSDSLTGLGNRRELSRALARAVSDISRPGGVGMLYCDVDNFKLINDSLGHDIGDEFLQETARRIRLASRSTDALVRLGGDEFVVLLDGTRSADDALHYAKHLRRELVAPMTLSGHVVRPSFSMGVGFADRSELADDPGFLMSHADTALLEAKKSGEGEIAVFDAAKVSKARTELKLVGELSRGLERDELCLHYQPIVDLLDHRRIVSVEGLVRWNHPERGLVPPDVFIPIAEQNKMITRITSVVLAKGLRELRMALDAGALAQETALAINITVRDLRSNDFALRVERALEYAGLGPAALHVELTESAAIDDQRVFGALLALRDMGVHIAIDDFGTGYASLSYLRDVPASLVKIDRSFVQQMDDRRDRSLIAGAIAMSHELGMPVIAEGVETAQQVEALLEMGCDYGQGYLFARPTPDLQGLRQALATR